MSQTHSRSRMDMLHGPVWNQVLRFAIPVAATGMLEQLFNASDIAIVGSFAQQARTEAVAAVGANSPIIGLIVNFFIGIAMGVNVVIARAIGENRSSLIERAVQTSILTALLCGVMVAVAGELCSSWFLSLMNIPEDVFPLALDYIRIYLAGMPAILLYNFESSIFRSIGQTKIPLSALAVSGLINVGLNLFFVIVLNMAVSGVAIATVISNVISSLILFFQLLKTDQVIHLSSKKIHFDWKIFLRMMQIGLPAGIQSSVFSIANIIIQAAVNSLGTVIMAASSAAYNVEVFCYYILNSFTQACTTFVSQNYGAGQYHRCKKILGITILEGEIATILSVLVALYFGHSLLAIFNNTPEVIENGYYRLLLVFSGYVFSVLYESFSGYLRGFGISFVPAVLTVLGVCGIRLSWVAFLFPSHHSFPFLMVCFPVSLFITAVLLSGAVLFYRPAARKIKEQQL